MPVTQCRELRLVEPFNDGEDGRVDEADVRVGILVADVADTWVVLRLELFDSIGTIDDVIEQCQKDAWMHPPRDELLHLDEGRRRHNHRLIRSNDQMLAGTMVRFSAVE